MPQEKHALFSRLDPLLLTLCLITSLYGLGLVYSATRYDAALHSIPWKQAAALGAGLLAYVLVSLLPVEAWTPRLWKPMVLVNLALLLLLIPFGNDDGTGNKSWLSIPGTPFNLQPGELVKLSFILLLSYQLVRLQEKGVRPLWRFLLPAGHTLALCALLFGISGDMGMALVYLALFVFLAWCGGVQKRWLLAGGLLAGVGGVLLWPHLPTYIQLRLQVVWDHDLDPLGKGFQQTRSLLAIGSGQVAGQGYLGGIQTQSAASSSLPARHTDFLFSAAAEELGLLGCGAILLLLAALTVRCFVVSRRATSPLAALMAAGIGGMLAIQTILNVGMCLFLAPVVGLTLPFFSYGGSSLATTWAAMGIVSGIEARRRQAHYDLSS